MMDKMIELAWYIADNPLPYLIMLLLLTLGSLVGVEYLVVKERAAAFQRVTGKEVSTWDAMFLDLRVEANPKEANVSKD